MRIVLPFCPTVPHGFYHDFFRGLSEAIRDRGDQAVTLEMKQVGEHDAGEVAALQRELERGCDLLLDLCSWGYALSGFGVPRASGPPQAVFDALGVRYVGMLFDQPYFQPINAVRAQHLYATFPDLGHREQAQFVFTDLKLEGDAFAPPAVRAQNERPAAERDIDVLYFGNLDLAELARPWRGSAMAPVCDAVAESVRAQPERPFHRAVADVLKQQPWSPTPQQLADVVRSLELFVRNTFRHDAVVALARAGLRLTVVGRGWESIALPGSVRRLAPQAYDELFRLAGRSRVCIDASTYLSGANDRIFNYALNGAVCATNATGYLQPAMGGDEWLLFYSLRELDALAERIRALLAEPQRLREMGEAAKRAVLARHTWANRLETIVTCFARR